VNEGDGFATITVNRVGSLTGTASVDYGFTGTATLNDDFLDDGSGTLIFPDGVSSQNFQVAILNDEVLEGDETIVMELLIPDGAILGSPSSAILTIIDDDECVFALTPSSATIAAEGGEGEFSVSYTLGCNYVDTNDDDWITYTAQSFGTEATVQYFVSPNTTGQPRTGIISVGNNDFTIFQEAEQPIGDTTPPEVVSVTPPNGTENIDSNNDIVIQIEFSEEMDPSTISPETILLNQDDGTMGVGYLDSSDYSYSNRTATIIIPGGGSGYDYNIQVTTQVKDLAGNSIPSTYESYFATDLKLW
jgi:hypothetical protein